MKIFWSWQSDTPGKVSRHFVRDALRLAIEALKQAPDVEEPTAAETRESIHLDHDRQGVTGSPDLARTIFEKIDRAAVFVADVTLVGTSDDGSKRLINPNVAIEYGHAHHALGDEAILMVQNTHCGDRDALPFDLKHKAGPIQYRLAPDAKKTEIEAEQKSLVGQFITALRPFVERRSAQAVAPFQEKASTDTPAVFFEAGEVLGRIGVGTVDEIEYRFAEPRAFYLRLIPTAAKPEFKHTTLMDIAGRHRPDVLSQHRFDGYLDRNEIRYYRADAFWHSNNADIVHPIVLDGRSMGRDAKPLRYVSRHDSCASQCAGEYLSPRIGELCRDTRKRLRHCATLHSRIRSDRAAGCARGPK